MSQAKAPVLDFLRFSPVFAGFAGNGALGAIGGPISSRAGVQDDVSSQDKLPQTNICLISQSGGIRICTPYEVLKADTMIELSLELK